VQLILPELAVILQGIQPLNKTFSRFHLKFKKKKKILFTGLG